jgi:5-methylcytosine-specific restriction endonuclease McrA
MSKAKKGSRETTMFRARAISYLIDRGTRFQNCPSFKTITSMLMSDAEIPAEVKATLSSGKAKGHAAFIRFFDGLPTDRKPALRTYGGKLVKGMPAGPQPAKEPKAPRAKPQAKGKSFYSTIEWKRVRYDALKRSAGRCECCGMSPADGIVLNVDHIKPLHRYPELALELSNLQVLCSSCNWGKGGRDTTDWRQKHVERKTSLDLEYERIMGPLQ